MNIVSFCWLLIVVFKIISFLDAKWITGNPCWSMPCLNGGSCFGSTYTYLCVCPINYNGALCEKRLGICQENPCGNRGLCIERSLTSFECRCYYNYIGPTCEEHVISDNHNIWSSLLPIHTRILFNMLQESYHVKGKGKTISATKTGQIDFIDLLSTSMTSTTTTTTVETIVTDETTEQNLIIPAHDIQLEKIFPDQTTAFTEQSTDFLNLNTDEIISTEQNQLDYFDTTDDQEISNIITSTFIPWSDDDNKTNITQDLIEITNDSTESIVISTTTQSNIDDNNEVKISSSDQTTTIPINTSVPFSSSPITTIDNSHRQLLNKLCQQIFSHMLPNASLPLNSSSILNNNNTANVFLSWLNKTLNSTTTTTTTTTQLSSSSESLQRIDMDDVLHEMDNYTDDENVHH